MKLCLMEKVEVRNDTSAWLECVAPDVGDGDLVAVYPSMDAIMQNVDVRAACGASIGEPFEYSGAAKVYIRNLNGGVVRMAEGFHVANLHIIKGKRIDTHVRRSQTNQAVGQAVGNAG